MTANTGENPEAPADLSALRDLARCSLFAALIGAGAFIVVPAGPLFFSLQTMAVSLAGFALGTRRALVAIAVYLAAGFFGMPMFGMGKAGPLAFMGPTGGYFLGFVIQAAVAGMAHGIRGKKRRVAAMAAAGTIGFLAMLACGALGLWATVMPTWNAAFLAGMAPFLPVEPVKLVLAIALAETRLVRTDDAEAADA